jgi:hypothetical protein
VGGGPLAPIKRRLEGRHTALLLPVGRQEVRQSTSPEPPAALDPPLVSSSQTKTGGEQRHGRARAALTAHPIALKTVRRVAILVANMPELAGAARSGGLLCGAGTADLF